MIKLSELHFDHERSGPVLREYFGNKISGDLDVIGFIEGWGITDKPDVKEAYGELLKVIKDSGRLPDLDDSLVDSYTHTLAYLHPGPRMCFLVVMIGQYGPNIIDRLVEPRPEGTLQTAAKAMEAFLDYLHHNEILEPILSVGLVNQPN